MLPESPGAGGPADSEPLIFVSDASAEAERLTTALRMRGYVVIDVSLALLVSRVAVQRPSIILCDVDAPGALDTVGGLRDVPGGSGVDIIFIGEAGGTLDDMADAVFHESSGFFVRPVDVYALLRKVEALIGPPSTSSASLMPSSQRGAAPSQASVRPSLPLQPDTVPPPKIASSNPPRRLSSPPPRSGPAMDGPLLQIPPSSSPADPGVPSLPPPVPLGFGMDAEAPGTPFGRAIPQSNMSPELERLLARAEQRVTSSGGASPSMAPVSDRLTPDDEVEAVLPADVLAALDEPLGGGDADDDNDLGSAGGAGTNSGSEGGRTGLGGTSGTGRSNAGGTGAALVAGTRSGSMPPSGAGSAVSAQSAVTVPPARTGPGPDSNEGISEPPATPPAMPTRPPAGGSWPPVSAGGTRLGTNVEAASQPPPRPASEPPHTQHGVPPSGPGDLREPAGADASTRPPARGEPPVATASPPIAAPPVAAQTSPPRREHADLAEQPVVPDDRPLAIPSALGVGDAVRGLARVVRARYTGALVFEDAAGIRRVVVRDGDFVTVASGVDGESLVAFLRERGVVGPEVMAQLGRKVAQFGRHAGAALIAHGHLRQDELWPVLRAHAEWLIGRIVAMAKGAASLEPQVPARLQAEPAVFGGATGAEVLVEIVRRCVTPKDALARLGGGRARLGAGLAPALLTECALSDPEIAVVNRAPGATLDEALENAPSPDFATVLYALAELGILEALAPSGDDRDHDGQRPPIDRLDEQALRARIIARAALVEEGDYFAILGVSRRATSYDIKRAFLELRREFEPNRILTPGTADLRDQVDAIREVIDEAYDILRDQLRRDRYRRALEAPPH